MSTDRTARGPLVDVRRLATRTALGLLLLADLGVIWSAASAPLNNSDTYFHLRFGEEFLHHWSVAHPGQPNAASSASWVPTQWLSQVGWALAYDHGGVRSLALLAAVLVTGLLLATYVACRTVADSRASFVAASAALIGATHWLGLRPQLVSFVLTAVTVAAWNRSRSNGRTPWWLIPMTWLWAMCHGMWILGVVVDLVAVASLALEDRDLRQVARRCAVPLASMAAACVTPVGPRLLAAVLQVNSRSSHFAEWAPVPLLQGWGIPTAVVLGCVAVARMRRGHTAPYPLAMLALAVVFAAYSGRTIVAALVVAAPLLAAELGARRPATPRRRAEPRALALLALTGLLLGVVGGASPRAGLDTNVRPFAGRLEALSPGTVVLTDHTYGAVLLWRYPSLEVPMHGYGDVFTDTELDRYDGLSLLHPGWIKTLHDLHARVALLDPSSNLGYALKELGWVVVQRSPQLELLEASPRRAPKVT